MCTVNLREQQPVSADVSALKQDLGPGRTAEATAHAAARLIAHFYCRFVIVAWYLFVAFDGVEKLGDIKRVHESA